MPRQQYTKADEALDTIIAFGQRTSVNGAGRPEITTEELAAFDAAVDYLRDFKLAELVHTLVFRRDEIADQPERTPEQYPGELERLDRLAEHLGDRKVLRPIGGTK